MQIHFTIEVSPEQVRDMYKALLQEAQEPSPTAPNVIPFPAPKTVKPEKPLEQKVSKDDIYKVALDLSKAGKQTELMKVFEQFDAKKLSDVKVEDYPAVYEALKKIGG